MLNYDENSGSGPRLKRGLIVALTISLILIGVLAFGLWRRPQGPTETAGRPVPKVASSPVASNLPADLVISPEMIERAGIKTAPISTRRLEPTLRTTATVQPNAYRETPIMPLVEGRVTSVRVQLGDRVREGQVLATIYSAELAEAQMKYLTVEANLQFHANQAKRFEKLADLGAVSRQELEEVNSRLREHHAEHAALRERMILYGLNDQEIQRLKSSTQVRSEVPVHAPAGGIVTTRDVNVGQNLSMRDRLFTLTDLSTVWVIANVYEKDFSVLQTGRAVAVTTSAWPGREWSGRISYIDPRIDETTRTARVRIELGNQDQQLRLGMFVDVAIRSASAGSAGGSEEQLVIPRAAIQNLGNDRIAFVPVGSGRFQVRRLLLGAEQDGFVQVLNGLAAGDEVVTDGSFFLMAELGRKGSG
jgi:cobalt-zinc-cadmium efflux system membrane fusion protein